MKRIKHLYFPSLLSVLVLGFFLFAISCQKAADFTNKDSLKEKSAVSQTNDLTSQRSGAKDDAEEDDNNLSPAFNLDVELFGSREAEGELKFRQNPDPAKIIDLDIRVEHLMPNHEYKLQRAVDAINQVDGNCTSTTWLTLGKGLTPQSIFTDDHGKGHDALWRDVSAIATGSKFDIHFQVIDAATSAVVLSSNCYQYQVR